MEGGVEQLTELDHSKIKSFLVSSVREEENEEMLTKFERYLDKVEDIDSVRDRNDCNNTLLHVAVTSGNSGLVKIILKRGGCITAENDERETPLSLSAAAFLKAECTQNNMEIHRLLCVKAKELAGSQETIADERGRGRDVTKCGIVKIEEVCKEPSSREICKGPDLCIDVENESVGSLARKMGVDIQQNQERIILKEGAIDYLNRHFDPEGDTVLMKFAELEKADVVAFLLKCEGLQVNATNKHWKTAADFAYAKRNYACLLKLLEEDSLFPDPFDETKVEETDVGGSALKRFLESRQALHEHIIAGDLEGVKDDTKSFKSSYYFNKDNESALYCAAKEGMFEVCAYLWFLGVKFWGRERKNLRRGKKLVRRLRAASSVYFIEDKDAHIHKLMASTKVRGKFTDERKEIVAGMYKILNKCEFIALIMKVLKNEDVDVVLDFESDEVDRIYPNYEEDTYGLADTEIRRIYVGAKACMSEKLPDRKVAGTLAHELTHLAVEALYGNYAKPYSKDDIARMNEYKKVVNVVEGMLKVGSTCIDDVITRVFNYEEYARHAELIVRVPHILAMYGEEEGMGLLRNQAPKLLDYFAGHVVPDCKKYTDSMFFEKPLCLIQTLQKYHGCVQHMEEGVSPLKKIDEKFEGYLNSFEDICILVTSNTKLCFWHVYNELKEMYKFHLDKCCLFFQLDRFESNWEGVLKVFRCKACKYLVLVTNDVSPDFLEISNYFDGMENFEEKKVILIVNEACNNIDREWKEKIVKYGWNHMSESFQWTLLNKEIVYQGKCLLLRQVVNETLASEVIDPEVLSYFIDEESIKFGGGSGLLSTGYNEEYYIERSFVRDAIDDAIFNDEHGQNFLFVTGLPITKIQEHRIDQSMVQIIEKVDDCLLKDKKIILPAREEKARNIFERICKKDHTASFHWLHLSKGIFYWRTSKGTDAFLEKHRITEEVGEKKLMERLQKTKDKVFLISDGAGSGKSTVLSELISKIKGPNVWIGRINFNDYADSEENPKSLANIKEGETKEIVEYFLKIVNAQNPLELSLLKSFLNRDCKVKVFMDGFDEIAPFYKEKALALLRTLKNDTGIQMWVTTRKHEKVDLEIELEVCSYEMKPWSSDDQACYMDKFWKHSLKSLCTEASEESVEKIREKIEAMVVQLKLSIGLHKDRKIVESFSILKQYIKYEGERNEVRLKNHLEKLKSLIKKLDFNSYACIFLDHMGLSINDQEKLFTGLPLHLNMLAEVSYHENLKIRVHSGIYNLYSEFVNNKVGIFLKDKCRNTQGTQGMMDLNKTIKKKIIKFHRKIATLEFLPHRYSLESIKKSDVYEFVHLVGLATEAENGKFQFVHQTFAEYFFSESVLEGIRENRLEKWLLVDVLMEPTYRVVRKFVNSVFRSKHCGISFNPDFVKELDVNDIFSRLFMAEYMVGIKSCKDIWADILRTFEQVSGRDSLNKFISIFGKKQIPMNGRTKMEFLQLLQSSLSDETLSDLFDSTEFLTEFLFHQIQSSSPEDLRVLLAIIKRVLCYNACAEILDDELIASLRDCEGQVDRIFEMIKDPHGAEQAERLLDVRDMFERNLLHYVCNNNDEKAFPFFMEAFRGMGGEEVLREQISKRSSDGNSILHEGAKWNSSFQIVSILKEVEGLLERGSFVDLITGLNRKRENFLHRAAFHAGFHEMKLGLEYIRDSLGPLLTKEMLFQQNLEGNTVLYVAAGNDDFGVFEEIMKTARNCSSRDEFEELVMGGDNSGRNVSYERANYSRPLHHFKILENYIGRDRMLELLTKEDGERGTCLHVRFGKMWKDQVGAVVDDLRFLSEVLDSDSLTVFLTRTDEKGNTFLHLAAENTNFSDHSLIFEELKVILPEKFLRDLMNTRNNEGERVGVIEEAGVINFAMIKQ